MKKYSKYKNSGVEWIGAIPVDWEITKMKYGVNHLSEKGKPDKTDVKISPENVESDTGICFNLYSEHKSEGMRFQNGDILLNKLRLYLKKILFTEYDGFSLGEMIVLRTNNKLNNKYFYQLLFSQGLIDLLDSQSTGIKLPRVSPDVILNTEIVYPPLNEQQQIASFLDTKTELIDSLIEKTARKIELLKEKRTALINEIVTGKIVKNGNAWTEPAEVKDSGVEWIGEIPSHWDRLPLKQFGQVTLGKMLTSEDKGGYFLKPYLRSTNIQVEVVDISDVKNMWFSKKELEKLRLKKGDLLFNEGGDVGRTCIWLNELEECYIQNSVNRVRFENDEERYYLHLSVLYHSVGYYDSLVNRVSIPHLTKEKLESVIFLRPPTKEQKQIIEYLDEQTGIIKKTISNEEKRIELLKEYRQSLISEVVTGKRKVTN